MNPGFFAGEDTEVPRGRGRAESSGQATLGPKPRRKEGAYMSLG